MRVYVGYLFACIMLSMWEGKEEPQYVFLILVPRIVSFLGRTQRRLLKGKLLLLSHSNSASR